MEDCEEVFGSFRRVHRSKVYFSYIDMRVFS